MAWENKIYSSSESQLDYWRKYYHRIEQKAIYHSPDYIKVLESQFGGQAELFIFGDEKNFIYYPYLKKNLSNIAFADNSPSPVDRLYDVTSSWYYGGPLTSSGFENSNLFLSFLDSFHHYAQISGIVTEFIRFDANLKNYLLYPENLVTYNRKTVYVQLSRTEGKIWSDFSGSNRRAIKKAKRVGLKINVVDSGDVDRWKKFHAIYESEMHRKKAPAHLFFSFQFFLNLKTRNPNNTLLLTIESEDKVCGGFIIVYDDHFAFHFLSASLPEYWPMRVNNLLFYSAIKWAKQHGCLIFDFMGGRAGVYQFKRNFSKLRRKFFVYRKIHHENLYLKLKSCWSEKREKEDYNPDFFPVYRQLRANGNK